MKTINELNKTFGIETDSLGLREAIKSDILSKKLKAVQKLLPSGFVDTTRSASTDVLKGLITESAIAKVQLANEEATDEELIELKDKLTILKEDYRNDRSALGAKIKWCVHLLETRG